MASVLQDPHLPEPTPAIQAVTWRGQLVPDTPKAPLHYTCTGPTAQGSRPPVEAVGFTPILPFLGTQLLPVEGQMP